MRDCKVIATYFGPRRYSELSGTKKTIEKLDNIIDSEIHLDKGRDNVDTLIVNHDISIILKEAEEGKKYLDKLDGMNTKNGKIRIFHRPWDTYGISYNSFNWIFEKLRNEYFYWFFTEDDTKIILPNYYNIAVQQFEEDDEVSFLCCLKYLPLSRVCNTPPHCHFGVGLTSIKYLNKVYLKFGTLSNTKTQMKLDELGNMASRESFYLDDEKKGFGGEIFFTNSHIQCGFKLREIECSDKIVEVYGSCGGIY